MVIVILISLLSTSFLLVFGCGKKQAKPVPPTSVQANPSSISKVGSNSGNSPKQAAPAEVKDEKGKPPDNGKKEVEKTQDSEKRKASKELAECTGRDKSKKGVSSKKVDKKTSKEASKMAGKDGDGKAMPGSAEMSAASAAVPPAGGGAADDGGYEDCPDLTPEELAKIAAGGK